MTFTRLWLSHGALLMCFRSILVVLSLLLVHSASAVTLEQLSLEELVASSTFVVRARVAESSCVQRGALIYTEHVLQVAEVLHGETSGRRLRLSMPGGQLNGQSQTFSGVPSVEPGEEYVFFLWRGRNGLLQLVGMAQGLLQVKGVSASAVASRPAIDGTVLNRRTGYPMRDTGLSVSMTQLRGTILVAGSRKGGAQ